MSGPKTSRYTLTPEQRRMLAEQRKIERRKAVATESIRRNLKKLLQVSGMFNAEKQIATELAARIGNDSGLGTAISELEKLIAPIQPSISRTNYDDVSSVEQTAKALSVCLTNAEKLVEKISAISSRNESILKANLQSAIDEGFTTSFADIKEVKESLITSLHDEAALQLGQLKRNIVLPKSYLEEIDEALKRFESISDESFLKNSIALTVNPLLKKAKNFISEYSECHEEFEALYAEYIALCGLYYYVAQEYSCSPTSIQALREEIHRIKDSAAEDDEQSYISECLDEVMAEMGYSVLGSRKATKKNGKHFRNELYTYGEGTAVNITYSSDGRIAMELGGIDTSDRIPNSKETAKLCDSMEHFCEDFKEIEKRLLAKGVVLSDRISLLPPDAEYAQIINTSEYEMKTEAESIKVKKQRRSITKQKALKKE